METVAIITGDIVHSKTVPTDQWSPVLKEVLQTLAPDNFTIFRGDSFQLKIPVKQALTAAYIIKSKIKSIADLDVRMGIGIGTENYTANNVSESNGSAYIQSGYAFDHLQKSLLFLQSEDKNITEITNLLLQSLSLTTDHWPINTAAIIHAKLMHSDSTQIELSQMLNKNQSTVSDSLKRGGFRELENTIHYYQKLVADL